MASRKSGPTRRKTSPKGVAKTSKTKKRKASNRSAAGSRARAGRSSDETITTSTQSTRRRAKVKSSHSKSEAGTKTARRGASKSTRSTVRKQSESTPKKPGELSGGDLEYFRKLLLDKRAEVVGDVDNLRREAFRRNGNQGESETAAMPTHMADAGSDQWEQEFTLGLLNKDLELLREIDEALERTESGAYGYCVATGKRISKQRLKAKPWAKYCIEYVRMLEQGRAR